MKRLVVGLSLVAALACLLSPAMAETKEPQAARTLSAADRAFLASLAAMPVPRTAAANASLPDQPIPPECPPDWCTSSHLCAASCSPCAPIYYCQEYQGYCGEMCDCDWGTCPM